MTLRLAFRTLLEAPFVTFVAILSLALGTGANTAIDSLFDQVVRPAPGRRTGSTGQRRSAPPKPGNASCNQAGSCDAVFSYPMFRDLERPQTVCAGVAAHRLFAANLWARGQTLSGDGLFVSPGYLATLGLPPALGACSAPTTTECQRKAVSRF